MDDLSRVHPALGYAETHPAKRLIKPNGALIVVENCSIAHRTESRADQTKLHDIAPDILEHELTADCFVVKERIDPILVESADRFRYLVRASKSR